MQVGGITLAQDGTKILANASKHSAVSHGHCVEQMKLLEEEIATLMRRAEDADSAPLRDGLSIPAEITRRQDRLEKLKTAAAIIRARAEDEQAYNAQAAVDVQSRLIVAGQVVTAPNDKEQLASSLGTLDSAVKSVSRVLVDSGFYSEEGVKQIENTSSGALSGVEVLAATQRHKHAHSIEDLEKRDDPPPLEPNAPFIEQMKRRLQTRAGRAAYDLRKSTIEPVFGIIKESLGFRRFSVRGLARVNVEWKLVSLSYNLKRLFHVGAKLKAA